MKFEMLESPVIPLHDFYPVLIGLLSEKRQHLSFFVLVPMMPSNEKIQMISKRISVRLLKESKQKIFQLSSEA